MAEKTLKVTKLFFDKPAVINAVDKAAKKNLSKYGSFVRRTAKQSIKKRKASSEPGQPVSSHKGDLKRLIFFAYEPQTQGVVVGPEPFGSNSAKLLEYGGTVTRKRKDKMVTMHYHSFPTMRNAAETHKDLALSVWRNSVK